MKTFKEYLLDNYAGSDNNVGGMAGGIYGTNSDTPSLNSLPSDKKNLYGYRLKKQKIVINPEVVDK